jgi:hypothetical protein
MIANDQPESINWWDCQASIVCTCGDRNIFLEAGEPETCQDCGRIWKLTIELTCTPPKADDLEGAK